MTTNTDLSREHVTAALRRWTGKSEHTHAAQELLIEHGYWLGRRDFVDAALNYDHEDDAAMIWWSQARDFLDTSPRASTTELAVLDFAIALGEDRYRFSAMGHAHRDLVRTAVRTATGQG